MRWWRSSSPIIPRFCLHRRHMKGKASAIAMNVSDIKRAACLGGGVIGASWAIQFAMHGLDTALYDINGEQLEKSRSQMEKSLDTLLKYEAITAERKDEIVRLVHFTDSMEEAVSGAQFLQESGPERLNVKRSILAQAEQYALPEAIYASSTSGLLITDIAAEAKHPERCVGAHPYNPPHLIPLVELTRGEATSEGNLDLAYAFYQSIGKEAVLLRRECPGFIANRLQLALFRAGELFTPAHIGVLASQGISEVRVYRKPRAAVISTGSELLAPGTVWEPGKIYDSNLYILRALLEREGYAADTCVHVPDDADSISGALRRFAPKHDLILTTGGASVGDKDLVPSALERAGAEVLFARVQMKPGSCCFGAVMGGALLVSLSGNPGAALTAYYRIALPAVRRLTGRGDYALRETVLPLRFEARKTGPNPRILKGHAETVEGVTYFAAHEGQKNGMQLSFLGMDALAELPPLNVPLGAGTKVRVFFP